MRSAATACASGDRLRRAASRAIARWATPAAAAAVLSIARSIDFGHRSNVALRAPAARPRQCRAFLIRSERHSEQSFKIGLVDLIKSGLKGVPICGEHAIHHGILGKRCADMRPQRVGVGPEARPAFPARRPWPWPAPPGRPRRQEPAAARPENLAGCRPHSSPASACRRRPPPDHIGQRFRARRNDQKTAERKGFAGRHMAEESELAVQAETPGLISSAAVFLALADDGRIDMRVLRRAACAMRVDEHVDAFEGPQFADEDQVGRVPAGATSSKSPSATPLCTTRTIAGGAPILRPKASRP